VEVSERPRCERMIADAGGVVEPPEWRLGFNSDDRQGPRK
jgi:hypothetical protein